MNNDISHLTASAAALLAETDEQRMRAIRSRRWVLYPRAKQALDRLNRLLDHPRGTRMPSVVRISLVCFGVNEAREAISGDVQLARRFEQFTLSRWAANEQFETLVVSILRNTPLRQPSVLTAKSLRRMLQITEGITANGTVTLTWHRRATLPMSQRASG
ncbi:hypothetical protein AJ87_49120 [Rhizobium yanglingense]|nr:hypothetical protein AJ87_49120 [Rhizobium yanglingense]